MIDSRLGRDGAEIRRRRECLECGRRFTTRERVEEVLPRVIKQDGRREDFQREKLVAAIAKACQKRKVPTDDVEKLIDRLERAAKDLGQKEIESAWIGERVMDELVRLDPLAAARFASVFRDFQNADDYQDFFASLLLQTVPELRFKPTTRYENACATGSAAIHGALDFLAARRGRFALVVGPAPSFVPTPGALPARKGKAVLERVVAVAVPVHRLAVAPYAGPAPQVIHNISCRRPASAHDNEDEVALPYGMHHHFGFVLQLSPVADKHPLAEER